MLDNMMASWMIVNNESEQLLNDDDGLSLSFSSPEDAEKYLQEQGVNGTIVETPNITEGIP